MGRFSYTWSLMRASWDLLKKDKELLVFPVLSGIACLLVLAVFAVPIAFASGAASPDVEEPQVSQALYYAFIFVYLFCSYFVVVFFNSAIISCAIIRMQGGDPTVSDGLRMAGARIPYIAAWALLSATVGLILRIIEDKSRWVGRLVAGLLGMAWAIASFLAVPILVVEKKGPIDALKESTALLKKTWGEQLISRVGFGLVFGVLAIPGILLFLVGVFAFASAGAIVGGVLFALGLVYLILLALIQSALHTIFQAALYLYARHDEAPAGFDREMLSGALARK